jgi:flagellar motor switch protein FliG
MFDSKLLLTYVAIGCVLILLLILIRMIHRLHSDLKQMQFDYNSLEYKISSENYKIKRELDKKNNVLEQVDYFFNWQNLVKSIQQVDPPFLNQFFKNCTNNQVGECALILSIIPCHQAGPLFSSLSPEIQKKILDIILYRHFNNVQLGALQSLLQQLDQHQLKNKERSRVIITEIFSFSDKKTQDYITTTLSQSQGNEHIFHFLLTWQDIPECSDRLIQVVLREISNDLLIDALKKSDENIKKKFLDNMSEKGAALILDDMEAVRDVSIEDESKARHEIMVIMRLIIQQNHGYVC